MRKAISQCDGFEFEIRSIFQIAGRNKIVSETAGERACQSMFVEGRIKRSGGVPVQWLAERMAGLGAVEAINLDGGKTSCLLFMGTKISLSNPDGRVRDGRSVSGLIGLKSHK